MDFECNTKTKSEYVCTWYDADAVPKTKPSGKLLRLNEETSITDAGRAKVIDGNVSAREKKRRRIKWLHAMFSDESCDSAYCT